MSCHCKGVLSWQAHCPRCRIAGILCFSYCYAVRVAEVDTRSGGLISCELFRHSCHDEWPLIHWASYLERAATAQVIGLWHLNHSLCEVTHTLPINFTSKIACKCTTFCHMFKYISIIAGRNMVDLLRCKSCSRTYENYLQSRLACALIVTVTNIICWEKKKPIV